MLVLYVCIKHKTEEENNLCKHVHKFLYSCMGWQLFMAKQQNYIIEPKIIKKNQARNSC